MATLYWLNPIARTMYPNWEIVLIAIILFRSLATRPQVAPKNAVDAPIKVITNKAVGLNSKIGDDLRSKYIPAVTRVAACNKAETGVGKFFYQL